MTVPANVAGVLLAGGRARRMGGGDKGLRTLGGRPVMDHVVERARPQVAALLINANSDPERFSGYGLPVVPDVISDESGGVAGPLAGVLTGMEWAAASQPQCPWVATFACDAPFAPSDLVERLLAAVEEEGADIACAASRGRAHPVFGLWPVAKAGDLRLAMTEEDMRKIDRWTGRYKLIEVDFAADPFDPFFNINAPENLAEAEKLLSAEKRGAA
ncbi:MAG: molybdenum cofactor guanylyltransferase MobA [Rhodospirillaceae bacterium]|jgi:molybdopterin-guanine dinucleotide biosynthesis protein A|nr:molybdenum cofactor guanylyltransferase MobA [Rhodospirillaceae bacterium]|tara:strand:+ start:1654 stop:2301 length:648 start_codon:yes stop_codon:yes gene_type:complete